MEYKNRRILVNAFFSPVSVAIKKRRLPAIIINAEIQFIVWNGKLKIKIHVVFNKR